MGSLGTGRKEKYIILQKIFLDQEWDTAQKTPELHFHVHEQQVEGLLLFAERMRWPHINELRDYAEDIYGNLHSGQQIPFDIYDWLFGLMLPGKWMSFKIMAALVLCTPSISAELGSALYYDSGLSLQRQSYWRIWTGLGHVLGCMPEVISLGGWISPGPPIEFIPPLPTETVMRPQYIRLKAQRVTPIEYIPDKEDGVISVRSHYDRYKTTQMQPDEDLEAYLTDIKDEDKWVIPEPPICELSTCTLLSIRLKKLPLDIKFGCPEGPQGSQ